MVCLCLQVPHRTIREEVRIHLFLNGHPSGIPIRMGTLMTVGIKAHELLRFATM
jgi:hypothetical protein